MTDLGETAQARRYYHHIASGASLRKEDVGRMVEYIETRDAEIERLRTLVGYLLDDDANAVMAMLLQYPELQELAPTVADRWGVKDDKGKTDG